MTFGPLQTERLTIRRPEIGDAEALHRRRNHPDAARYQDWPMPYSVESARRATAATATMDGPAEDEWWMMTIVETTNGTILGDVAINQTWQGRSAEIGYTLHPDHWGHGFATEAVGAVVDALIDRGFRRISATTDPDNWASNRLLEQLGFCYEGRAVGAYFEGDGPEAESGDGLLFGLTAASRAAWSARPTGRPASVRLIEIDTGNQRAVADLSLHHHQEDLVSPVSESYGDALFPPVVDGQLVTPWLRAIEIDDGPSSSPTLAGFVMIAPPAEASADGAATPGSDRDPYLWRLLIDRWHQRRGIASAALDQVEADLRSEGQQAIRVHWAPGPGSPEAFYVGRGYVPTGNVNGDEIEGRKLLR